MKSPAVAADRQDHLKLFRTFVSRRAAGNGRAVLEGVGLDSDTIETCFQDNPLNIEEAVQTGLIKWAKGLGLPSTWRVLIEAMEYAEVAEQHIDGLKKQLFIH